MARSRESEHIPPAPVVIGTPVVIGNVINSIQSECTVRVYSVHEVIGAVVTSISVPNGYKCSAGYLAGDNDIEVASCTLKEAIRRAKDGTNIWFPSEIVGFTYYGPKPEECGPNQQLDVYFKRAESSAEVFGGEGSGWHTYVKIEPDSLPVMRKKDETILTDQNITVGAVVVRNPEWNDAWGDSDIHPNTGAVGVVRAWSDMNGRRHGLAPEVDSSQLQWPGLVIIHWSAETETDEWKSRQAYRMGFCGEHWIAHRPTESSESSSSESSSSESSTSAKQSCCGRLRDLLLGANSAAHVFGEDL